jgi:hypothetical protein
MRFQCPSCGDDIATRVLADSVTLIVVGRCEDHGLAELTRVYLGESDAYPAEPAGQAAYKPGSCCGRRLGDSDWCHLPIGHAEPHAG